MATKPTMVAPERMHFMFNGFVGSFSFEHEWERSYEYDGKSKTTSSIY